LQFGVSGQDAHRSEFGGFFNAMRKLFGLESSGKESEELLELSGAQVIFATMPILGRSY
jgi:hypothetical protein